MKLIFEKSTRGHYCSLPATPSSALNTAKDTIGDKYLRKIDLDLPEVSEIELVRHYTALARKAFGVDDGFYPLGSCTMKYNPKLNEDIASLSGFTSSHPYAPPYSVQGNLEIMYKTEEYLKELSGMDAVTLQPAAGAHGELAGMMMIKKYHNSRGDHNRTKIIVPDSAHGTNPASAVMAGFKVVEIASLKNGRVDVNALKAVLDDTVAGLMLTNPNTLGLYETDIIEITDLVHESGGLVYYDGANFNAIMGKARPGDMGFDVIHFNLHKSFSTPHGGGGPGSGPVGVKKCLVPFLPAPAVEHDGNKYSFSGKTPDNIKMRSFYGNFLVVVRALAYMLSIGKDGMKEVAEVAVLNSNYLRSQLAEYYEIPHNGICMHEFVVSCSDLGQYGIYATDIAKGLIDMGYHPPTTYFPLIVKEALMIEPTETESLGTLDEFISAMIKIREIAEKDPETLRSAPHTTPIGRPDEVAAARSPILKYVKE